MKDLDIAGGPELIESMDGSAGNYPGSNPHFGLEHFETHGWQRSKYGWIAPKEMGPTKSQRQSRKRWSWSRTSRGRFRRRLRTPKPVSTPSCFRMLVVVS